jgi:cell shape-determining protein MreD
MLIAGGMALLRRSTARAGAVVLGIAYSIFALFWAPRLYTAPHYVGFSFGIMFAVIGGVFTELIIVAAAIVVHAWAGASDDPAAKRTTIVTRWIFGLGAIFFGLNHLASLHQPLMLIYVPHWMPFGREFWVALTGVAFVLAGIAFLTALLDVLAAWLLGVMLLTFSVVTLLPGLILERHRAEADWGGNVYQIAAVAACWIFAAWLAARRNAVQERR